MYNNKLIDYPGNLSNFIFNSITSLGNLSNVLWGFLAIAFTFLLFYLTFYQKENTSYAKHLSLFSFNSSSVFLFITLLGILLLRLPIICAFELNPDESEWIVGAATLLKDCRFWLSVNGMTSGPLNIYPLCLVKIAGLSLNYSNVRLLILLFCVFPTIIFNYKSIEIIFNEKISRIITFLLFVFFSISLHYDILAYNSEHIPMLLTSIAFYLFVKTQYNLHCNRKMVVNYFYFFLCGLVVGIIPYSKLQAITISFSFFIGVVFINIVSKEKSLIKNIAFLTGIILPSFFILLYLFLFNLKTEFINYYILNNIEYSNKGLITTSFTWLSTRKYEPAVFWYEKLLVVPRLIFMTKDTTIFFGALSVISVFSIFLLLFKIRNINSKNKILFMFLLLNFFFGYYAIIKIGNVFLHYIILLITPSILLTGFLLGLIFEVFPQRSNKLFSYLKYYILLSIVIPVVIIAIGGNFYIRAYLSNYPHKNISNISTLIKQHSIPGDKLAVWGYLNSIYIETELIQGTREPNSYLQITESPLQKYFTEEFCKDIVKNKPVVFVDVVGKSSFFYNDYFQRFENFPAIRELINKYYEFSDSTDNARIYIRKKY